MKKTFHILTVALLTAVALLTTGCTIEDTPIDGNDVPTVGGATIQFTATLAPREGITTRAITTDKDANNKEVLNVAWKKDEKVCVYYLKNDGKYTRAKAIVTAVDETTGAATINATLADVKDGSEVKFVYPASLAKDGDIDEDKLLTQQNGLLRTGTTNISRNFDAATQTGKISVSGDTASVKGIIAMENRVCICKIALTLDNSTGLINGTDEAGKTLTIAVGDGRTYTISSPFMDAEQSATGPTIYRGFKTGDVIYVAMLPISSQNLTFMSVSNNKIYSFVTTGVTLEAGKFYRNMPVMLTQMNVANRTLTDSDTEMMLQDGDMLTGTGGTDTWLKIADGAMVTLNGVNNTNVTAGASIPGIECLGDATIVLIGENRVMGCRNAAGIFVPEGKTLTIRGIGSLNVTGGDRGAGIGGAEDRNCGNIEIQGGIITATGKGKCAGIGSGWANGANVSCEDITISGGTVTATGGDEAAGIGSGHGHIHDDGSNTYVSSCGAITISGGTVTATGGAEAAGIGSGSAGKFASISIGSDITRVTATMSTDYLNVPIGMGTDDQDSGAVTFGGVTMHDGNGDFHLPNWAHWPTDGQTYGGILVTVTNTPFDDATWTLTPAP